MTISRFPLFLLLLLAGSNAPAQTTPASNSPALNVTGFNITAKDLVWDPVNRKIYLSLPSADGPTGNAIQVLDPTTGALGTNVFAGSEPNLLAVSANSQYLYAALDGSLSVQRFTLPTLQMDINTTFGGYAAMDLQTSPVSDGTVAAVLGIVTSEQEQGGVVIYDNGTPRADAICGFGQAKCSDESWTATFDSIQWNRDASLMFAANDASSGGDFYVTPVTAAGFGTFHDYQNVVRGGGGIHFDPVTGYVFYDDGAIVNPASGMVIGNLSASGKVVVDGALGVVFLIQGGGPYESTTYTVQSFDSHTFAPISAVTLTGILGTPSHFIRWGNNGLAFTTQPGALSEYSQVYVLSGSFVGAPPASGTIPVITSGLVPLDGSATTVQAGEWCSIYGTNLATSTATWNGDFPTSLGGATVTVGDQPAYLSYASPGQINLQVPNIMVLGAAPVIVTTTAGTGTSNVTIAQVAPSFPLLDATHVAAIILRMDGSGAYGGGTYDIVGPTGASLGYKTVAAKAGDSVALFAVGLGPTTPAVPPGQAFEGSAPTSFSLSLLVNGVAVKPSFAGLSSAGLYQINFTVPTGLGTGDVPISVKVQASQSPSTDVISLQ